MNLAELRRKVQHCRNRRFSCSLSQTEVTQIKVTCSENDAPDRSEAFWLLSVLPRSLIDLDLRKAALDAVKSPNTTVAKAAAWSLLALGPDGQYETCPLKDFLQLRKDADPESYRYLTGAAWTIYGDVNSLSEVTSFLVGRQERELIAELRTAAEIGVTARLLVPKILSLVENSSGVVQRLAIRSLGSIAWSSDDAVSMLRAYSTNTDEQVAMEARVALAWLKEKEFSCGNRRYCATVIDIDNVDRTTAVERAIETVMDSVGDIERQTRDFVTSLVGSAIRSRAHEINSLNAQDLVRFQNAINSVLSRHQLSIDVDRPSESQTGTIDTEVRANQETEIDVALASDLIRIKTVNHNANEVFSVDDSLNQLGTEVKSVTELSKLVQEREYFEHFEELEAICDGITELHFTLIQPTLSEVNKLLAAFEGRKIRKQDAQEFVERIRKLSESLGCHLVMDGYPITISVSRDLRYHNARFSIREIGRSHRDRIQSTATQLPLFSLVCHDKTS